MSNSDLYCKAEVERCRVKNGGGYISYLCLSIEQPVLCNWFKADGAPGDVYFLQVGQDTPVHVRDDWCSRLA